MSVFIGFDTSNYTTSVAVYNQEKQELINCKKLLPVGEGEIGLMQSKALFEHTRQLPLVLEAAFSSYKSQEKITAVCVSNKPRQVEGSYMPVFLAGVATASAVANSHKVPLYYCSHQQGHIIAALYSANRLDLTGKPFIAFHVSGGTTEALLVTPDEKEVIKCELIAQTLDLNAGQAIDRIGVMLGLPFPAGPQLEKLSQNGKLTKKVKPTLKGNNCCLSGLENQCQKLKEQGASPSDIALYTLEFVAQTLVKMKENLTLKYGDLPFVFAGGVMSNELIKSKLENAIFATPEFSADNAAGIAILASIHHSRCSN